MATPNTHMMLQLALCTTVLQMKGNLTLHHLMELFYKLCAVLLCDTCKQHSTDKDLPGAAVTTSLPPLMQPFLNGCFFIKARGSIALVNYLWGKPQPLQDGPASSKSISADILSEEDSISLTSCSGQNDGALLNQSLQYERNHTTYTTHTHTYSLTVHWLWEDRVPVNESYLRHALDNLPPTCTQQHTGNQELSGNALRRHWRYLLTKHISVYMCAWDKSIEEGTLVLYLNMYIPYTMFTNSPSFSSITSTGNVKGPDAVPWINRWKNLW